jgi:RNA 2',3'-cyclic 3'-phosphodiesterase
MRLFVALDLPASVKKSLTRISYGLSGIRWVEPDQMHLTLRFIGDTDYTQEANVRAALEEVSFAPFELQVRGVGQFPPQGAASVLWAGVDHSDALENLAKEVDRVLVARKLKPDKKPFEAHITLGRMRNPMRPDKLKKFYSQNEGFELEPFKVNEFALYSSLLTPDGAIYTQEQTYAAKLSKRR